jgi:outer membrane assembly lipoprotein YfgL
MRGVFRAAVLLSAAAALVACSSTDKPKPTPLETFEPKIAGRAVWNLKLPGSALAMTPAVRDGVLFVASGDGTVMALQAETGTEVWRASAGSALSAGVGSDGRYTSVVTRGNEVVTFDAGREVWRKRLPSSVVTAPLVAGERVFVMSVDRAVHAFDAVDGRRLWVQQRPGDALTLAQGSVVMAFRNTLLVGQGPRLAALDPLQGTVLWEVPMASPRGTNEVERLADLIGPAVRIGDRVCARAFQSAVACADASKGVALWSRTVGGVNAVASDNERVFGADASDRITAWRTGNGDVSWTTERLLYRGLSGALSVGPSVVFGDSEGFVHFLSSADGSPQLRLPTDGSAIVGTPLISGTTMVVMTRNGGLFAFRPN